MKRKLWAVALSGALALCIGLAGCGGNASGTFDGLQKVAEKLVGSRVTQEQLNAAAEELKKDDVQYTVKTAYTQKNPIVGEDGKVLFYFQNEVYTVHTVDGTKQHITQTYRAGLDLLGKETFEITDDIIERYDFIFSHSIPSGTYTDDELSEAWANAWNEWTHEERQESLEDIERGSLEKYRINVEAGIFGREYLAWDVYKEVTAGRSYCYWKCYDGSCVKQSGDVPMQSSLYVYDNGWFLTDVLNKWDVETLPSSEEFLGWKAEHSNASLKEFFDSVEFERFRTRVKDPLAQSIAYSDYDEETKGYMGYLTNGETYGILKFNRDGKVAAWYCPESFVPWDDFTYGDTPGYFHTVIEYDGTKVTLPTIFVSEEA